MDAAIEWASEEPGGARPRPALLALATGLSTGAIGLAAAGTRWSSLRSSGAFAPLGVWSVPLVASGALAATLAVRARDEQTASARRASIGSTVVALVVGLGAAGVATARLVRAAFDSTTVAAITPSAAGYLAPIGLLVALGAAATIVGSRRGAVVVAATVLSLTIGTVAGLHRVGPPTGVITDPATTGSHGGVPIRGFFAHAIAPIGDVIYGADHGDLQVLDERGRLFRVARANDLRPPGYVGHVTDSFRDNAVVVSLFPLAGSVAVATQDAVFTASRRGGGRMLVAIGTDRSETSLAMLTTAGVPLLPAAATVIVGAGPDGRGGLLVATDAGVLRVGPDHTVTRIPGADAPMAAALVEGTGLAGVRSVVLGRSDGSVVLGLPCGIFEIPLDGAATRVVTRDPCGVVDALPSIAIDRSGVLTGATADGAPVTGDGLSGLGGDVDVVAAFDDDGRLVSVADGRLVRSVGARS